MTRLILCAILLTSCLRALPPAPYDDSIFQKRIPPDQLAFLKGFAGARSGDLLHEKQFRAVMKSVIPDCTFHYGWDMSFFDAMDTVLKASPLPVLIRNDRYVLVAGQSGPWLGGRGFLWLDMQTGIGIGGLSFHPTNGEPTPTLTVFSRQIRKEPLGLSDLPPEFATALHDWSAQAHVPQIVTRYFIGGANKRILLEHDEDFCMPQQPDCDQMNADAADVDLNAAYYLEQVHYATNATAWMIVPKDHIVWVRLRDDTCRVGPEPLRCRIRMTRERIRTVVNRVPPTGTRR